LITFKRTWDTTLVESIVTHPKLYRFSSDDRSPRAEDWRAPVDPRCWYVLAYEDDELLGLYLVIEDFEAWEIHVCLLPSAWGETALRASREIAPWLFARSECPRLECAIREDNRLALRLALRAGFRVIDRLPSSWLQDGRAYDRMVLSLEKQKRN
jgi:RimJ/RimL family protein N-acetyltransferase